MALGSVDDKVSGSFAYTQLPMRLLMHREHFGLRRSQLSLDLAHALHDLLSVGRILARHSTGEHG